MLHQAVLFAFGWYLIIAPSDSNGYIDNTRPIKEWVIFSAFDKADECEKRKTELTLESVKKLGRLNPKTGKTDFEGDQVRKYQDLMRNFICVPTDKML